MKDTVIGNLRLGVIGRGGYWILICYDKMKFLNRKRPQSFLEKDALQPADFVPFLNENQSYFFLNRQRV